MRFKKKSPVVIVAKPITKVEVFPKFTHNSADCRHAPAQFFPPKLIQDLNLTSC
jgi:hypothetical protein